MQQRNVSYPSAEHSVWIWIILAALLVLAAVVGVASLALMNWTQQAPEAGTPVAAPPTAK